MQGYGTMPSYSSASAAPRIGEWLSEAFNLFKDEWKVWVGQGLVYVGICLGPVIIGYVVMFFSMFAGIASSAGSSSSSSAPTGALIGMMTGMGIFYLALFLMSFIAVWLMCGMKRTAAKQLRGEPITVRDIFSGGDVYWAALGGGILTTLATMAGTILLCIGAYLVAGMLIFVQPLIVEGRMGVVAAMQRSWEATRPHMWMYLLFTFLIAMISGLGANFCLVGMAVTMPIYSIALMVAYRDVFGIEGARVPAAFPGQVPGAAPVMGAYGPGGAPMMGGYCPQCRRPIAAGAVMCPACGTALGGAFRDQG
jgi:hypothetical protein